MYKILLVEDEELIRKGLAYMVNWCELDCCVCGEASDGEEGLRLIQNHEPDIVICDIRMPVMDGLAMLEHFGGHHDFEAVILSGYSDFEYAKKAIRLGVKDYLTKPVDFDELRLCIRKLTAQRKERKMNEYYVNQARVKLLEDKVLHISHVEKLADSDKYTRELLAIISANYHKKINLYEVSSQMGVSSSWLNGKLKAVTGYTFNSYLNRYRITKAVELLCLDELLIYEVADKTGFYDYKYFIKVFKKYIGCTPAKFVKEQKQTGKDD